MNWLYPLLLLVGFLLGVFVTLCLTERVFNECQKHVEYWHQTAMKYMELWFQENEKRRKAEGGDDADWWKK